jgi:peroxiredoxin Q/BCP
VQGWHDERSEASLLHLSVPWATMPAVFALDLPSQGEHTMTAWKRFPLTVFALTAVIAATNAAFAEEGKTELKKGDKAPSFQGTDDQGNTWKSSDHVGKKAIVVYFYPADFTGGCTKQACSFRDDMEKLTSKGIEVVGISGDSARTHGLFKKYHKLNYTLLADEKGEIAKKFGVPVNKGGKAKGFDEDKKEITVERGVTILRWTFVIGKDGTIIYKNPKVNAAQDSKQVLEAVEKQGK